MIFLSSLLRVNALINLKSDVIRKTIPENEKPEKVTDIVEKMLSFNKQQIDKELKVLTPKQMLQRQQIALAQVKASNTSKILLNEIRQNIYSLYRAMKLIKKHITI